MVKKGKTEIEKQIIKISNLPVLSKTEKIDIFQNNLTELQKEINQMENRKKQIKIEMQSYQNMISKLSVKGWKRFQQ